MAAEPVRLQRLRRRKKYLRDEVAAAGEKLGEETDITQDFKEILH